MRRAGFAICCAVLLCRGGLRAEEFQPARFGQPRVVPEQTPMPKAEPKAAKELAPKPSPEPSPEPKMEPTPPRLDPPVPPLPLAPVQPIGYSPFDSLLRLFEPARPGRVNRPQLLGDVPPVPVRVFTADGPILVPSVRSFKMGDNQSPQPQDNFFVSVAYFSNLYGPINRQLGADLSGMQVTRTNVGVERLICDEHTSVGLVMPTYTVSATSGVPEFNGSRLTAGDLTVFLKRTVWQDCWNTKLVSAGLAVTTPTGPDTLFGNTRFDTPHNPTVQPFAGYLYDCCSWYFHGFTSLDVPMNTNNVTLLYNDFGLRYRLYQNPNPRGLISAAIPTLEAHVATPLNNQGVLRGTDVAVAPHAVNLTIGVDLRLFGQAKLVLGYVTPVTGPKLLDYEVQSQFSLGF